MNNNFIKYFENDFDNVDWKDMLKEPKSCNQDIKEKKKKNFTRPWEVNRNYQLERDCYDYGELSMDGISDPKCLDNTFNFYKSTNLSLSDFSIQFSIECLFKCNYDKIRKDYELSKNKEKQLRDKIPELKKKDRKDLSNREKKMLNSYLHHTFTIQRLTHYDIAYCDGEIGLK